MKQPQYKTRVEVRVQKGMEELLPEDLYLLSPSGVCLATRLVKVTPGRRAMAMPGNPNISWNPWRRWAVP